MKTIIIGFCLMFLLSSLCEVNADENQATDIAVSAQDVRPLSAGATVPSETLTGVEGKAFDLDKAIKKQPTIVIFYRGGWCPYCNRHLGQLQTIEPKLIGLGYQILAISPDRPAKLAESIDKHKLTYTLLSDHAMKAARAFGIAFRVDDATLTKYKGYGIDLEAASGENHHLLPVPSVFIVGTDGAIKFSYANPDYRVRLAPEDLLKAAQAAAAESTNRVEQILSSVCQHEFQPVRDTFDRYLGEHGVAGLQDAGWIGGVTGQGSPKWSVEADATAPSKPNVLKQSGEGTYAWCVKKDVLLKDGFVEVKFKPISGNEDQAGGLIWRWYDGDNYYIARANALEDNMTIYHIVKGSRRSFKNVKMKVASNQWHTLRADFGGNKFKVTFDGKVAIEATDDTFKEAGAIGVWTKADSVTLFDDFSFGGNQLSQKTKNENRAAKTISSLEEKEWPQGTSTPSEDCGLCHQAIYREFTLGFGSDLSYKGMVYLSSKDKLLNLPSNVSATGTAHSLAGVDPFPIHARGVEEKGKSCNVCHFPEAFEIPDLESLNIAKPVGRPKSQEATGLTCASCHLTPDGKIRGLYGIKDAPHQTVEDPKMQTSAMCAYCHAMGERVSGKQTQTFLEWREDFHNPGLGRQQCQDCHMPRSLRKTAEDYDVPIRAVARHLWTGGHSSQRLRTALSIVVLQAQEGRSGFEFHVINIGAGHSVPTGSSRRAVYLQADVVDRNGMVVAKQEWMFAPWYGNRPDDKAFLEEDKKRPDATAAVQADAQGPHEAPIHAGEERILSWTPNMKLGHYTVRTNLVYDLNRYNERTFTEDQTELYHTTLAVEVK